METGSVELNNRSRIFMFFLVLKWPVDALKCKKKLDAK